MKAPESRPPANGNGFLAAALSAPGLAAITFMAGALAMSLTSFGGLNGLGSVLINAIFLILIATVWGAIPSFVFGGLVLAAIRRIPWHGPPGALVYLIGGVAAAGLYVLAGLGIARLSTGAAMFLAPWATPDLWSNSGAEALWLVASLLLAGAAAGLIYGALAKRG